MDPGQERRGLVALWRCCLLFGGCCAVSACAMAPPATAYQLAEFGTLHGTHRFLGTFSVRKHRAELHIGRGQRAGIGASYSSPGRIDGTRVRARFGGLGLVDVSFEQEGETVVRPPPPSCEGAPRTIRSGSFVGTIRFDGERGFSTVDAARASGTLKTVPEWTCPRPGRRRPGGAVASVDTSPAVLEARGGPLARRVALRAVAAHEEDESDSLLFSAGRLEARPRLRIDRYAYAFSSRGSAFEFDQGLSWATLAPPPPFDGSARFTRDAGDPRWTGSLTVDLPGVGPVRLGGEDFTARLYRGQAEDDPGY
jgi:hypothetical protein